MIIDTLYSRKLSSTRIFEPEELPIPPPYVVKPYSETLIVDETDDMEPSISQKLQFKKKTFRRRQSVDVVENDNPFSTTTSSSLLRCQSLCQGEDELHSQDVRFPYMCVIPFLELSKTVRSKSSQALYNCFVKENPDFFNWGDLASIVGDEILDDVTFEWMDK